jgi:putative phosphonate metabolism protein
MSARYAVYFSPEKYSLWWAFGNHWLGRSDDDLSLLAQPQLEDIALAELDCITAEPRRYGFHATLKAPFRLAEGLGEADLVRRLAQLARDLRPVPLGPLRVTALGNFAALVPASSPPGLEALAAACVRALDDLRAPLSDADRLRRRTEHLDARELELFNRYGYPYVMERFRLHLTLSGPVGSEAVQRVAHALAKKMAQLNQQSPLSLDRLCLFVERTPGSPFQRIADMVLPV